VETLYYNNISTNTGLVAVNRAATSVVNGQARQRGGDRSAAVVQPARGWTWCGAIGGGLSPEGL